MAFWNSTLNKILLPLTGYGHHRITLVQRCQVSCCIEMMQCRDDGEIAQKFWNGFRPEEMNNIEAGRKMAEAFDGLPDGKLRADDGLDCRIVFPDLVSKISYDPIQGINYE